MFVIKYLFETILKTQFKKLNQKKKTKGKINPK